MKIIGAPKLVVWAEKIRKERMRVWQETSPEVFKAIEPILTRRSSAEWWISNKDKGLDAICKQVLGNLK